MPHDQCSHKTAGRRCPVQFVELSLGISSVFVNCGFYRRLSVVFVKFLRAV